MLTFLTVHEVDTVSGQRQIAEVQAIFRESFSAIAHEADELPVLVRKRRTLPYDVRLIVAERRSHVEGFALLFYFPEAGFAYLDYFATSAKAQSSGLGAALYDAVRETAQRFEARGLLLEVRPDDRSVAASDADHAAAIKRLRFYERLNVLPITGTTYDKPTHPGGDYTLLLYDGLGRKAPPRAAEVRAALAAILVHKYAMPPSDPQHQTYVRSVTDPIRFGPRKYSKPDPTPAPVAGNRVRPVKIVLSTAHAIHHIPQRGYVETPARVDAIARALEGSPLVQIVKPRRFDERHIRAVHDADFVNYLRRMCKTLKPGELVYPYVFPLRRPDKKPREMAMRAGYYCMDTFTPLSDSAYEAARAAVDVAVTGAFYLLHGHRVVYALCRPPGHHAERRVFGGFCYFNNAAIAANVLAQHGRVALLDLDYHHGNGSQDIFYERSDVLVVSVHGHPNRAYPYFSGFEDETGAGEGVGYNVNIPLPERIDDDAYARALSRALAAIKRFSPNFLVLSLGFDIAKNDPTGDFSCTGRTFERIGTELAALGVPVLTVQEGGYNTRQIGAHARRFFHAIAATP